MRVYNIEKGELFTDIDTYYDKENNKIDVYSSVNWSAENEEEYNRKEGIINNWVYEDDLVIAHAWCDVSGFDYWVVRQEEPNYVSIDVVLKKDVKDYTQEEQQKIRDIIIEADEYFKEKL